MHCFLCVIKQNKVRTGPECSVKQSLLSVVTEHGNMICEHNTSLAFEICRLQFHLHLHG